MTIAVTVMLFLGTELCAAGPSIGIYRLGQQGKDYVAIIEKYLESKGYHVTVYEGEETIEGHVEKASLINRSGASVLLAMLVTPGTTSSVLVARTEGSKGDGRFLTVDEIPERFSKDSQALGDAIAGAFAVKTRRLPLFPLLGIAMPGVFIKIQGPETEMATAAKNLHLGLEKYFRKG